MSDYIRFITVIRIIRDSGGTGAFLNTFSYRTPPVAASDDKTLFRWVFSGLLTDEGGGEKAPPFPKTCHINPTKMKLGTVIPYL